MILGSEWGVSADVWSVTSWTELRRDGLAALEHNFLHPEEETRTPYVTTKLADAAGPIVASTDYVSDVPDQIRQFVPNPFATLGANDHGFSDTRAAARRYFHIDAHSIVVRALQTAGRARRGRRRGPAAGGREVPAARRPRRHHRHRGRRELSLSKDLPLADERTVSPPKREDTPGSS